MSKKKKKLKSSNPNGILPPPIAYMPDVFEWYTDEELGYWSPIIPHQPDEIIKRGTVKTDEEGAEEAGKYTKVPAVVREALKTVKKVDELAAHWSNKVTVAGAMDVGAGIVYALTIAGSSLPFIDHGAVIDEVWRIPILSAGMEMARNIHLSPYNLTQRPLIARHLLSKTTPLIPEDYRLALAAAKGILTDDVYTTAMAQRGLDEGWAEMWREENYLYPPLSLMFELSWRGLVSEDDFTEWMQRNNYPSGVIEALSGLRELIPPAPDLITMVVREAFLPEMVIEAPDIFAKYMTMKGYGKEWADRYWTSHFLPIPLTQAYENLWRGLWTKDEFMFALHIQDIHPMWREDIYNVAFNPPSLREMGYGWDTGVYEEADIEKYRRWGGLSPEDAELSARSMVAYRTEAEREAVRREYLYLFVLERIDEKEFRENLKRLITADEAVELWVERGVKQRERKSKPLEPLEYRMTTASEAKWMFVNGLRDEGWYSEKLADLDWDEERINVAVERAKEEMKPPEVIPEEITYRNLTVAQIKDLYGLEKIKAEEVPSFLEFIGYSPEDAEKLAQVLTYEEKVPPPTRALTRTDIERAYDLGLLEDKDLVDAYVAFGYSRVDAALLALYTKVNVWYPDLKKLYSNGWITENEMYAALLDIGLPKERADVLMMLTVKFEAPARTATERDLTKSEILKGAKKDILTVTQAMSLLQDLGYEEGEAMYLLVLNDVISHDDPESYWEMKRVTEAYKKAMGKPAKIIPDDLLIMEQRVKQMRAEIEKMKEEDATNEELAPKLIALNAYEANYRKLIVEWERQE